jgi:hypothetical protein
VGFNLFPFARRSSADRDERGEAGTIGTDPIAFVMMENSAGFVFVRKDDFIVHRRVDSASS